MKRYRIVYNDGRGGGARAREVEGEVAASAVLAALLVHLNVWGESSNVTIRTDPPAEYRKGDEVTVIYVGPIQ